MSAQQPRQGVKPLRASVGRCLDPVKDDPSASPETGLMRSRGIAEGFARLVFPGLIPVDLAFRCALHRWV